MKKTARRVICLMIAGSVIMQAPAMAVKADVLVGETSIVGIAEALNRYYETVKMTSDPYTAELYAVDCEIPENLAIANVTGTLNIRRSPGTSSTKIGILPKNGACIVESVDEEGWAKITSGNVTGYVSSQYLLMGEEAVTKAKEVVTLYATVNSKVSALNVRTKPSTGAEIITKVGAGERLVVTKEMVINKEDPTSKCWVEVKLDDDEKENAVAYVSADYVTVSYELAWANGYTPYGKNISDARVDVCDYAKLWIGTKYVWGGNSLTEGVDCSGFVQQVFKQYGFAPSETENRWVSRDMAKKFREISISELKPGDLIFYGKIATNYINHVAIYIGNDQVIHSSTNYNGVAISSMYFYSILKCCRVFED